jgi:hypothetical protein
VERGGLKLTDPWGIASRAGSMPVSRQGIGLDSSDYLVEISMTATV